LKRVEFSKILGRLLFSYMIGVVSPRMD
jgi:hypothetical protein